VRRLAIVVVGSGFAGSILARALQLQGHRVTLVDRQRHPRFALGESSTPLAALSLERLAGRGLDDLRHLAAYGRWRRHLPRLRCGLKRGFTFYAHRPGEPFANDSANACRLLVAASPADAVADTHWLREDVDWHLARQAAAAGVACLEEAELTEAAPAAGGWRLRGSWRGRPLRLEPELLIDASGGGFVGRRQAPRPVDGLCTSLLFGHFEGVGDFAAAAAAAGAELPPGPYPEHRAAVHHLLREGWMYVLPFDHGVVSAGFVLATPDARARLAQVPPERAWDELMDRYPSLAAQFAGARPVRPLGTVARLQRRLRAGAGAGWAMLPHAFCFFSPMFSTGIAWSLVAVERLCHVIESAGDRAALNRGLDRYGRLLVREAEHLRRLISGAYLAALADFDLFTAWADLYFAAVTFAEVRQRLCPEGGAAWAWEGLAGATDPVLAAALRDARRALRGIVATPLDGAARRRFAALVRRRIADRNIAGFADPARRRMFAVDHGPLLENPHRVGLTGAELRERLHLLRAEAEP
jgi:tetracycline 7-halogenase / FADH2 O2-dependent halogenase